MRENDQSEERYRTFVESSTLPIIILQGDPPKIVYSNHAITNILGYTPEEMMALSSEEVLSLIHREDRSRIKKNIESGIKGDLLFQRAEGRLIRKDGTTVWIMGNPASIYHKGNPVHMTILVDITDIVLAEAKMKASNLEHELYTSLLRHDFKNDLMILKNTIELLEMPSHDSSDTERYLTMANTVVSRMSSLIRLFESDFETPLYSLIELVEARADHARKIHPELIITIDCSEKARNVAHCYHQLLSCVFDNLFRNAASYAGPRPEVNVKIEIENDYVQLCFTDNGAGIPSEMRGKLFTKMDSDSGGGMGLYLCRQAITGFGGTIELLDASPYGSGAAFQVMIPKTSKAYPTFLE